MKPCLAAIIHTIGPAFCNSAASVRVRAARAALETSDRLRPTRALNPWQGAYKCGRGLLTCRASSPPPTLSLYYGRSVLRTVAAQGLRVSDTPICDGFKPRPPQEDAFSRIKKYSPAVTEYFPRPCVTAHGSRREDQTGQNGVRGRRAAGRAQSDPGACVMSFFRVFPKEAGGGVVAVMGYPSEVSAK